MKKLMKMKYRLGQKVLVSYQHYKPNHYIPSVIAGVYRTLDEPLGAAEYICEPLGLTGQDRIDARETILEYADQEYHAFISGPYTEEHLISLRKIHSNMVVP
jgi:hypothetical protein